MKFLSTMYTFLSGQSHLNINTFHSSKDKKRWVYCRFASQRTDQSVETNKNNRLLKQMPTDPFHSNLERIMGLACFLTTKCTKTIKIRLICSLSFSGNSPNGKTCCSNERQDHRAKEGHSHRRTSSGPRRWAQVRENKLQSFGGFSFWIDQFKI